MARFSQILFLFFLLYSITSNAHVQHYSNLNKIEFEIYRNNKYIGKHVFSFKKNDDKLEVESKIDFQIKKLGIVLYDYQAKGTEVYNGVGKLTKFNSSTNQNGKIKYVNLETNDDLYIIDGSSYKGEAKSDFVLGTWWNHSIVDATAQISAVSGRIIHQKVTFLGKEKIKIDNKDYNTLHFNFSSTDKKLGKKKKLNTDVWYDEKSLNWVKASFNKQGKWEYKLKSVD